MIFHLGQLVMVDNYTKGKIPAIILGKKFSDTTHKYYQNYWVLMKDKLKGLVLDYFTDTRLEYVHKSFTSDPKATGGECIHYGKFTLNIRVPYFDEKEEDPLDELSIKDRKITREDVINYLTYIERITKDDKKH